MMRDANIVCRELDCGNPVSESRGPLIEDGRRGVRLFSICSGDESSIRWCKIIGGPGVCDGGYYHHVTCSGKRLVILRDLFIHYTILPCIMFYVFLFHLNRGRDVRCI